MNNLEWLWENDRELVKQCVADNIALREGSDIPVHCCEREFSCGECQFYNGDKRTCDVQAKKWFKQERQEQLTDEECEILRVMINSNAWNIYNIAKTTPPFEGADFNVLMLLTEEGEEVGAVQALSRLFSCLKLDRVYDLEELEKMGLSLEVKNEI